MIFLGNREFVVGMRFAGIRKSFVIENREQAMKILKDVSEKELIIANQGVVEKVPELKEYHNLAVIPDSAEELLGMEDLKQLIKNVVGVELEVE